MKYIAYFFNSLYTFLGGTTTVIQVISIFTTAFVVGIFAPVVLPIAMSVSVLAGIGVVVYNAVQHVRSKKKVGELASEVEQLRNEVAKLQKSNEQIKEQENLSNDKIAVLRERHAQLLQELALLERLRNIYFEKYQAMPADKLPARAHEFQQALGDSLANLHRLDDPELTLEEKIFQISKLNQHLMDYLESHDSLVTVQQIKAEVAAAKMQQGQESEKLVVDAKLAPKQAPTADKTGWEKLKPYTQSLSIALKTSLMLFSLCFGIATLGVALFVGPPLAVAATLTTGVLVFSGVLLAASLAIGAVTAFFSQKYISKEKSQFDDLTKEKSELTQQKQELLTAHKQVDKTNKQLKVTTDILNQNFTTTFARVKAEAQHVEQRLALPNQPHKGFTINAQQSIDIFKQQHGDEKSVRKTNGAVLNQDDMLQVFEKLNDEQKQKLIEKWRKEGVEDLPHLPEIKNH